MNKPPIFVIVLTGALLLCTTAAEAQRARGGSGARRPPVAHEFRQAARPFTERRPVPTRPTPTPRNSRPAQGGGPGHQGLVTPRPTGKR